MKSKKTMLILIAAIFLASIASVCAADANGTTVASEDTSQIELSDSNKVIEDNLQTSEENDELTLTDNDVLGADSATYSDLDREIRASGNVTLTHKNYIYDDGATAITITEDNKVIDGNGAIIDMTGSTIRAFDVIGNGVTIKNLTIKNVNFWENGGAIKFAGDSGTVINCNFINNTAKLEMWKIVILLITKQLEMTVMVVQFTSIMRVLYQIVILLTTLLVMAVQFTSVQMVL